jgi:hypothetical protein
VAEATDLRGIDPCEQLAAIGQAVITTDGGSWRKGS